MSWKCLVLLVCLATVAHGLPTDGVRVNKEDMAVNTLLTKHKRLPPVTADRSLAKRPQPGSRPPVRNGCCDNNFKKVDLTTIDGSKTSVRVKIALYNYTREDFYIRDPQKLIVNDKVLCLELNGKVSGFSHNWNIGLLEDLRIDSLGHLFVIENEKYSGEHITVTKESEGKESYVTVKYVEKMEHTNCNYRLYSVKIGSDGYVYVKPGIELDWSKTLLKEEDIFVSEKGTVCSYNNQPILTQDAPCSPSGIVSSTGLVDFQKTSIGEVGGQKIFVFAPTGVKIEVSGDQIYVEKMDHLCSLTVDKFNAFAEQAEQAIGSRQQIIHSVEEYHRKENHKWSHITH